MAGLMTPSVGSFVPVGETEERTKRLARAAADKQLAENTRQFDLGYGLDRDRFNENVRQFGLGYALDQQRLAENTRQFDLGFGLDERRLAEGTRQFDVSQKLARDTFNENVRRFGRDYAIRKAQEDRTAELFRRGTEAYEALQGTTLGATTPPNVLLDPQDKRHPLVVGMDSSGAPAVTVPLTEGPSTTTATAGLSIPEADLTPTISPYNRFTTRALVDEYIRQRNVAGVARGQNARKAEEAADALLAELQARGVGEEEVLTILKWSDLKRQRDVAKGRFRKQKELDELEAALADIDLNATGPSEPAALGGLDLGAFTATGRTADALTSPGTPMSPLPTGEVRFDVSNRRRVLDATRASLEGQFEVAKLRGDADAVTALQTQAADLNREETLVTGIESLQAAAMGNIEPLRQFLANQNRTRNVQIYQNTGGTLDIVVKGQRYAGVTLGDIRQQLLEDLDPATQQASAAAIKYQQELFLKLAPEMLKQQQARGEIRDGKFIEPVDGEPFLLYTRGNTYYKVPVVTTTVGGVETRQFGEEQPVGTVR